ncbi:hypothetical protein ACA910_017876 [Epithemia clementina (nom. ined.)]
MTAETNVQNRRHHMDRQYIGPWRVERSHVEKPSELVVPRRPRNFFKKLFLSNHVGRGASARRSVQYQGCHGPIPLEECRLTVIIICGAASNVGQNLIPIGGGFYYYCGKELMLALEMVAAAAAARHHQQRRGSFHGAVGRSHKEQSSVEQVGASTSTSTTPDGYLDLPLHGNKPTL